MQGTADNQSGAEKIPSAKILVVDDDTLNQRMMQVLLQRDGHQVHVVSSGWEAIEAVQLQKYDIIFMDLQMPVMDGIETSRRIRQWENGGQHSFIVALTASYLPEKGRELFEAGMDNYISKPFELEHIQRLLKYSLSSQSLISEQSITPEQKLRAESGLDVEKGLKQVGGDLEMYRTLLGDFIEGLPARLQSIRDFFARRDLVGLSRAAHNLNGVAANLGAWQLSEFAQKLDKQSVEGYTEALDHLIGEIQLTGSKLMETSNHFLTGENIKVKSI